MKNPSKQANIIPVIAPEVRPLSPVGVVVAPGVFIGGVVDEVGVAVGEGVGVATTKNKNFKTCT